MGYPTSVLDLAPIQQQQNMNQQTKIFHWLKFVSLWIFICLSLISIWLFKISSYFLTTWISSFVQYFFRSFDLLFIFWNFLILGWNILPSKFIENIFFFCRGVTSQLTAVIGWWNQAWQVFSLTHDEWCWEPAGWLRWCLCAIRETSGQSQGSCVSKIELWTFSLQGMYFMFEQYFLHLNM